MNDTTNATAAANQHIPETWDDDTLAAAMRKVVFGAEVSADVINARVEAAMAAAAHVGADVVTNVKDDVEVSGYVPAIVRVSERDEQAKRNVTRSVFVGRIPSLAALWETTQGQAFVHQAIGDALVRQIVGAIKRNEPLPYRLEDFTTPRGQEHEAFRKAKADMVKLLRKRGGLKAIDANTLEMCLRSQAYAESAGYGKVPAEKWERVIDMMIHVGKANDWNTLGLEHWKETRATEELEFGDIDNLDGIESMFGQPAQPPSVTQEADDDGDDDDTDTDE